jgi:hypothetical protein
MFQIEPRTADPSSIEPRPSSFDFTVIPLSWKFDVSNTDRKWKEILTIWLLSLGHMCGGDYWPLIEKEWEGDLNGVCCLGEAVKRWLVAGCSVGRSLYLGCPLRMQPAPTLTLAGSQRKVFDKRPRRFHTHAPPPLPFISLPFASLGKLVDIFPTALLLVLISKNPFLMITLATGVADLRCAAVLLSEVARKFRLIGGLRQRSYGPHFG